MKIKFSSRIPIPYIIICLLCSDRPWYFFLSFAAVALHEAGHIIAARLLGIRLTEIVLDPLGARLSLSSALISYPFEAALCAAGPLMNFLSAAALCRLCGEGVRYFVAVSLALGLLNLLPVSSFDGGRILCCALSPLCGAVFAEAVCRALSFACCFMLWCVSVYLLLRCGASLMLFVFSVSLFCRLFL